MAQREAQMGDAGVEVVGEALDHRGQLATVGLHEVVAEQPGQRGRGRLVTGAGPDRDLGPLTLRGPCSGGCAADGLAAGRVPGERQRAKRRCPPETLCASGHGRSSLPQRGQLATNAPMAEPHLARLGAVTRINCWIL